MLHRYDGTDLQQRADGITHAVAAARRGELVVVNTDSAYAVITDAFSWKGLERIREFRNRPDMSVPVLVGNAATVDGIGVLAGEAAIVARDLMQACWPGPLTLLLNAQPSLPWKCTPDNVVAARMPLHPWTLAVVRAIGPTACVPVLDEQGAIVTSASDAMRIVDMAASVYLDGGPCLPDQTSTIVDVTGDEAQVMRVGAISFERLQEIADSLA